jgi:hypothetical protein
MPIKLVANEITQVNQDKSNQNLSTQTSIPTDLIEQEGELNYS